MKNGIFLLLWEVAVDLFSMQYSYKSYYIGRFKFKPDSKISHFDPVMILASLYFFTVGNLT